MGGLRQAGVPWAPRGGGRPWVTPAPPEPDLQMRAPGSGERAPHFLLSGAPTPSCSVGRGTGVSAATTHGSPACPGQGLGYLPTLPKPIATLLIP